MKIKVKKTDKRHSGYDRFQFYIEIKKDDWGERFDIREKFFKYGYGAGSSGDQAESWISIH